MDIKKIKNTFSWTNDKICLKKSLTGLGVFAKTKIKAGTIIAVFGGYIMTSEEEYELEKSISDNALQINENLVIGIKNKNEVEIASFFNHSCNPNAGFQGEVTLVALKNILTGEEITFDYAMVLYNNDLEKKYSFKCLCNSKNCRKIITDQDWRIPEIQKLYKGFFQPFLNEKIKKLKQCCTTK